MAMEKARYGHVGSKGMPLSRLTKGMIGREAPRLPVQPHCAYDLRRYD
jgi:hypothetical protein